MESLDLEPMASNSSSTTGNFPSAASAAAVVKGKRTKRQRAPAATATSSTSSAELSGTTEEEEDMAHCLILLAQGRSLDATATHKFTSRRFAEAATTAGGKAGFYVYECKTCSKSFPSFQALGGHRASHKRPKLAIPVPPPPEAAAEDKKQIIDESAVQLSMNSFSKPIAGAGNIKSRVHECSICGSEFSSGQALGGHMRRHRPAAIIPDSSPEFKKQRNVLSLDLNLPAPSDDDRSDLVSFPFSGERPMVFSAAATATALVDCHY